MSILFDGANKLITLTVGTTVISVRDLWSRWIDWAASSDNGKYLPAFKQVGGDVIDGDAGTFIPVYAFMLNGWKIRPQEANHTLRVFDGVLLVDGGGDPFVNTIGSFVVRVNFSQPVQAITVATGGGSSGGGISEEQYLSLMAAINSRSSLTLSEFKAAESSGNAVVTEILSADVSTSMPLTGS